MFMRDPSMQKFVPRSFFLLRLHRAASYARCGLKILLLASAILTGNIVAADSAPPTKVVIGTASRSFNAGFSNMWIGVPLGLYGSTLSPSVYGTEGASQGLQLMLSNQVTMSTGIQDVLLNAQAEGRTLPVVIPCVYLRGMIHRISVLPDSPVKSIADLGGKTVGVPDLAAGVVQYIKFAATATGMNPDAIRLIAVGDNQQAMAALTSGRVDAIADADVDVAQIESLGVPLRVLVQPPQVKDAAVAYVFAFSRAWYDTHQDQAAAMLQGMIKALIVMLENPEAAVRISFYMYPQSIPTGISFDQAVKNAVNVIHVRAPVIERNSGDDNKWCAFSPRDWSSYVDMLGLHGKADASVFYTDALIDRVNDFNEAKLRAWAKALHPPKDQAEMGVWLTSLRPPQ
jgi:NitT/TauT family transport system substrate-binding protein